MASALLESLLADTTAADAPVAWLADARRDALSRLRRDGLSGARGEAWKYTSLRALEQRRLRAGDADAAAHAVETAALALPGIEGPCLVFVNGVFRADLSRLPAAAGVSIGTLAAPPRGFVPVFDAHAPDAAFERLNTALVADGPVVEIAAGIDAAEPLHLVYVGSAARTDVAWQLLAQLRIGAAASVRVIEHHVGASPNAHLGNLVTHCVLGERARLDLVQVQNAAPSADLMRSERFRLDREAVLSMHTVEAGARLTRHDLRVDLAGAAARFESRGVFALRGRQHADTRMNVGHNARDSVSDIVWRGVADERARGVFHGAITIAAGADGSDARLGNKNLLLSAQAEIDTQPVLEIHAEDVKAAHGATVGQLDERALFYLRSRGIAADAARRLLVGAFCRSVLAGISPDALRAHVEALLDTRLPQDAEH